jgi:hypothetical protein
VLKSANIINVRATIGQRRFEGDDGRLRWRYREIGDRSGCAVPENNGKRGTVVIVVVGGEIKGDGLRKR